VGKYYNSVYQRHHCVLTCHSHTPFAGAANIQDGVTIDLRAINEITLSPDRASVAIGTGNRWLDVYSELQSQGLSTSGGRVATVGVGGLVTGGGISFFSPRYGMVCDVSERRHNSSAHCANSHQNVIDFEVVLASGEIVHANQNSNSDLYKALKGGSSNFGIVTKFTMKTFVQGPFWGGLVFHRVTAATRSRMFTFFERFTNSTTYDPYAAFINSYSYVPIIGWLSASDVEYTKPEANPPVFRDFLFDDPLSILNTMRISNLTDFADEIAKINPDGSRQLFTTLTFVNNAAFMETFFQLADDAVGTLSSVLGLTFTVSFQPQPQIIIQKQRETGGNVLGLQDTFRDLVNVLLTATYRLASDDEKVTTTVKGLFDRAISAAKGAGVWDQYLYLNYAAPFQKPIDSYGPASLAFLQKVSQQYDPGRLFQDGVPGGFKLATTP